MLGLCFFARAFSSCGKRGPLFIAVRGPFTIAAPSVVGHRLQTRRLSSCGSQAQLLCSMWDPPRPGLEPVSPALAGRFSTTAPPGKPLRSIFKINIVTLDFFDYYFPGWSFSTFSLQPFHTFVLEVSLTKSMELDFGLFAILWITLRYTFNLIVFLV